MRAKSFFYVSAGLFLLALAYHLGARSVSAQSETIQGASLVYAGAGFRASAVKNGIFYEKAGGDVIGSPYGTPITSQVLATSADPSGLGVLLENGDVLRLSNGTWTSAGNLFGGATQSSTQSLGSLKARYR